MPHGRNGAAPRIPVIAPTIDGRSPATGIAATLQGMKVALDRAIALSLAILLSLSSTTVTVHAARPGSAPCRSGGLSDGAASAAPAQLACLSDQQRVDLLSKPVAPALLPPLAREHQLQSALHRWKASEAQALAVPPSNRPGALAAYLGGREIEALRTESLRDMQAEIIRAEARILQLGVDFRAATQLATRWIHRQPGRGVPAAYLERIVTAADAILAEGNALQGHYEQRDALNRYFDEQVDRVLTLPG